MIIVQARIPVQTEHRDLAYRHIQNFISHTRGEQGCIGCEAFASLEDPNVVLIHQAWHGSEDLDLHAAGTGLEAFLNVLPQFVDGEIATLRYDSAEEGVVEDIAALDVDAGSLDETVPAGVTVH